MIELMGSRLSAAAIVIMVLVAIAIAEVVVAILSRVIDRSFQRDDSSDSYISFIGSTLIAESEAERQVVEMKAATEAERRKNLAEDAELPE